MKLFLKVFLSLILLMLFTRTGYTQCAVNISSMNALCAGSCDGEAIANASGGTTPYSYVWSSVAQTNNIATGLCAGTYTVTVTDALGCTVSSSTIITEPPPITVSVISTSDASCFGGADGGATVVAAGGTSGFTYFWSNGTTGPMATGLTAGVYSVTAMDINGCVGFANITINEANQMVLGTTHTDASCFGVSSGSIDVSSISGGTAPYSFWWSNGETVQNVSGLFAGNYCVTVTDANGCTISDCTTITDSCHVTLTGEVRQDTNSNCLADSTEKLMPYQLIKIVNSSGYTGYVTTDQDGAYSASLDTGAYTLEIIPLNGPYWNSCVTTKNITIDSVTTVDTVDWTLESLVDCPLMEVTIAAPFLRRTGGGSHYAVSYCNNGTAAANNASVEVEIDTFLTVLGSSIPIVSQVGNTYTFDLDTVGVGECGYFYIDVIVNANAAFGQTHCSQAHIYPDSFCLPAWNGPILSADGECNQDTIYFEIKNTGANMMVAHNYTIFEDDIIIRMAPYNLNGGDSVIISQAVDSGKTYRIETYQATGFPAGIGPMLVYASIEGCLPFSTGSFNTGFLTQYYTGNTAYYVDVDCQQNIASYDPNDKAAQQLGYGTSHLIEANTPLDYRVRFQNTGTDTAFNVVVVDTLSSLLDPATIQMGASSHSNTWALSDEGVLTVTFEDIMLVDSNTNESLSHGFFTFTINQQPNLSNGSVINNEAAIYFDFNPPIITNTTFHTIGENFVPIILSMNDTWVEELEVHIYPNPTSGRIYVEQADYQNVQVSVVDNLGRLLEHKTINDEKEILDLSRYETGVYFIKLQKGQKISTHKVLKY